MAYNQMDSTNSAFKIPMVPLAPQYSNAQALLFNDIMEEKALDLRNVMTELLQVQPYRKFESEFSSFLKRMKRLIEEGQRSGSNISRLSNVSQICGPHYSRPSTSLSFRPPTTMSVINSNSHSTFRLHENNFQPIESSNPFKPPINFNVQPRVVLPRLNSSIRKSHELSNLSTTVIEVNQINNKENMTYDNHVSQQAETHQSNLPAIYSDVTIIDNVSVSNSQQNENKNEGCNSIESLLEDVGFKIIVGLPNNSKHGSKKSNKSHQINQTQINSTKNVENYLSMWSLNIKPIKSVGALKSSKAVIIVTGTLLEADQVTILEKNHDAGILEARKEKHLIKTNNGMYRLIGNMIGGSPNELYRACLDANGVPRIWRSLLKQFSGVEKFKKKTYLNFSLESPAGPIKPIKTPANINMSMTRQGSIYNENTNFTNKKRKYSENESNNSKNKQHRYHTKHAPLLASTPKRPKQSMLETPSQILKNRFHQNMVNKPKSNSQTLATLNDSIKVTKKRQSSSKEQISKFLKPAPVQSSNSLFKRTQQQQNLSISNTTKSSTSKSIIRIAKRPKSQTPNSSIVSTKNLINTKDQSKLRSSMNSSKSNVNSTKDQSKLKSSMSSTKSNVNNTKELSKLKLSMSPIKTSVNSRKISQTPKNSTSVKKKKFIEEKEKMTKFKQNKLENKRITKNNNKKGAKAVKNNNSIKKKKVLGSEISSEHLNLFAGMDYSEISDLDMLRSPSRISLLSRADSRAETPPLLSQKNWLNTPTTRSIVMSEPPTPLNKSAEAKALKRVKPPKITLEEELKNLKTKNKVQPVDFKTVENKINQLLEFGENYDEED